MKHASIFAVAVAAIAFAVPASAQCMSGMGLSDPGAEPVKIVMKYIWKVSEMKPTALKNALEKPPGRQDVLRREVPEPDHRPVQGPVRPDRGARDRGRFGRRSRVRHQPRACLGRLENPAGRGSEGRDRCAGQGAGRDVREALGHGRPGNPRGPGALSMEEIRGAVAPFKCDAVVNQTFEFVRYRVVEGDPGAFETAANALKGVMVIHPEASGFFGI
jgi:hypothetical protein